MDWGLLSDSDTVFDVFTVVADLDGFDFVVLLGNLLESIDTNATAIIPIRTTIVKMNLEADPGAGENWIFFSALILGVTILKDVGYPYLLGAGLPFFRSR